jgi:hypothetical protein
MPNARSLLCIAAAMGLVAASLLAVPFSQAPMNFADSGEQRRERQSQTAAPLDQPAAYARHLRTLGLTDEEAKTLVLARLQALEGRSAAPARFRYWAREGTAAALRTAAEQLVAADRVRGALREIFGAGAADDPIFARLFRPLDERLPFLTSEQQVRLHKARIDFRLAAEGPAAGTEQRLAGRPVSAGPSTSMPHPEVSTSWRAALATILDDELLFEYELRESPLAEHLRNSGVDLTEAEFRETYAALAMLDERADATAYRDARAALRALLGSQRFDHLWAGRDPAYPVVQQILRAHDLPEPTVLAAYGVINRTQDALVDATLANRDPARAINDAREIAAREQEQLAALVGDEIAKQVLTARAQALFEMSQQSIGSDQ